MKSSQCWVFAAMAMFVGCASTPPPIAEIRWVEASLEAAIEAGAATNTIAAHHVQLARDSLATANQFARVGNQRRAYSMTRRAESDAALATELARVCIATGEADAASRSQAETPRPSDVTQRTGLQ